VAERLLDAGSFPDALALAEEYPDLLEAPLAARLRAALEEAHGREWIERWPEGIPPWHEIPGGVNVLEILRLWTLATGLDMVGFGKMRYNLLGNGGHWFPGRNAADFDEPALRRAVANSPFADRIPEILRQAHCLLGDKPVERLGRD
ncbi:MAG: hypothetical protein N2322_08235, partial [Terrimicrobiaceae bacterium]|nr:hypothetical protein [Terrimicrobiaceae bacterium]